MNGFGNYSAPFHWFMLLWSLTGAMMLLVASARWRRTRISPASRGAIALLATLAAAVAAFIFYNTNVLTEYRSRAATLDWRAEYERRYAAAARMPLPRTTALTTTADLRPGERRFRIAGAYRLVGNATPIERLLVSLPTEARVAKLAVNGATLAEHDAKFGHYWFRFAHPLRAGEETSLVSDVAYENRGFANDDAIVANGSYILEQDYFPRLGYRRGYEIGDPAERKKRGLAPRSGDDDVDAIDEWIDVDTTITTDADQRALAPGRLIAEASDGARRTFHYRTEQPVHHAFALLSARYAVARAQVGQVAVQIAHDPRHAQNVPRMLKAASDALRKYEQSFGAYPYDELTVAEVPAYWPFAGYAHPTIVYLNEQRGFLIDARDPRRLDLVTRRVAHEVAHQWWGHRVAAAPVEGSAMVTESLAKYSELLMLEQTYGRDAVRDSLATELDLYLGGRTEGDEVPLSRATNQAWIYYRKGAIVMNGIRDLLGEAALNGALRQFAANESGTAHPTAQTLMRYLDAAATPEQRARMHEWVDGIVIDDFRITSAIARGNEVTIDVEASRDDTLEIALMTRDGPVLASAKHALRRGTNRIVMTVHRKPDVAVIDPWFTRIDRNRFDNERKVE